MDMWKEKLWLVTLIGLLAPLAAGGAQWKFVPEWVILVAVCIHSACTLRLGLVMKPGAETVDDVKPVDPTPKGDSK